jgi:methyl-accepting chemotaxis protein
LIAAAFQLTKEMMEQLTFVLKEQQETLLRNFFGSFICVCFIVFIVASVNFGRLTRRPLQNLQNAAKEFAKGNFSVRVPIVENNEVGEISEAFNHLMRHFEKILADATAITRGLLTSSSDILSSSRQLELNVVQQEKSIKEIALKSQETMHIVQKFAEDFKNVGRDISKTRLVAATGSANLAAMEKIMRQMIEASANIVKAFSLLQKKAEAMTQVIETIIRIADQSNLLALNTAIRASKAGEHGKGFVVIADKIRELADKISYAALDIETTIKVILEAVSKAVEEVGVFSGNIHNQFQDTLNINQEFNNLIYGTQGRIHYFEDISEGMKKQNLEIIEMNRGLEQLKNVSSQTAGAIKKLYVEIEYLFDSAQSLQEMTKDFIFTEFLHS